MSDKVRIGLVLVLIVAAIIGFESRKADRVTSEETEDIAVEPQSFAAPAPMDQSFTDIKSAAVAKDPVISKKEATFKRAPDLVRPHAYLNTDPFSLKDLIGKKVILIDFWTYSCINCQRTLPYVNAWHEKYKNQGLEIVGVHTPEFAFEKKISNVQKAMSQFGVKHRVVLDNDYETWRAYRNRYWPRKYLIDIDGFIVYDHIGEGAYSETESRIQHALRERLSRLKLKGTISGGFVSPKKKMSSSSGKQTPEIYFGADRNEFLGNGEVNVPGVAEYSLPPESDLENDRWYLKGRWNITPEFAENKTSDARIVLKYRAAHVYIVASSSTPVTVEVRKDAKTVSSITVKDDQLYELISERDEKAGEHLLELVIDKPGLRAFTFTFG